MEETVMEETLDYIECAGVRLPADWSVEQLTEALSKRKIRFANEQEIMNAFGNAIWMKASLESEISRLHAEETKLTHYIHERQRRAMCPGCGMQWTDSGATAANEIATRKTRKRKANV